MHTHTDTTAHGSRRGSTVQAAERLNREEGHGFSVYLQESGAVVADVAASYVLVMPDDRGLLPDAVRLRRTGVVVSWPTNPHNSGEAAVLDRLNDAQAREALGAPVTHPHYRADQDGRHWRVS